MKPSPHSCNNKKHSDYAASASKRWLACPGSVELTRDIPNEGNSFSFEGTASHELVTHALREKICPTKIRVQKYFECKGCLALVDDEMRAHGKLFYNDVMAVAKKGDLLLDTKFDLSWIHPGMYGTGDACVIEPWGDLWVWDYKYGRGVQVEAEDNSQLAYYGLGLAQMVDWDFPRIHLNIHQPRRDHFPKWTVKREALRKWVTTFKDGVEATKKKDAGLNPGDHCKFCPAKSSCPAIKNEIEAQVQLDFDDTKSLPVRVTDLTPLQISRVLDKAGMIEDWLKNIWQIAQHKLENGGKIPNYKLVDKRARRQWVDEASLAKKFKSQKELWTEPELKSPAQVEKILGKKAIEKLVVWKSSGKTVAREEDSRMKTVSKIEEDFDD